MEVWHKFTMPVGMAFACIYTDCRPFIGYIFPHSGDFNPPFTETRTASGLELRIFNYLKTIF
jgi:hypothetical protein